MKLRLLLLISTLITTGCLPALQSAPSNRLVNQSWRTTDIQQEIVKREKRPPTDHKNLFILALLHTHPQNQFPDYRSAKKYLARYLSVQSKGQSDSQSDWRGRHIHHLLNTITALEEEVGQSQSQTEVLTWEQTDCQKKQAACSKKLKHLRWALKKSEKNTAYAQKQLEEAQTFLTDTENTINQLESENIKLEIQLKKLTDLYLNLEKKRQAIQ